MSRLETPSRLSPPGNYRVGERPLQGPQVWPSKRKYSKQIRSAAAGRLKLWHCQTSALHVEAPELATPPPNWNATGTLKCVSIESRRLHHFSMTMSARREKNLQELVGRKGAESCWSRSGFAGRLEQNTNTWNAPELQGSQPETL